MVLSTSSPGTQGKRKACMPKRVGAQSCKDLSGHDMVAWLGKILRIVSMENISIAMTPRFLKAAMHLMDGTSDRLVSRWKWAHHPTRSLYRAIIIAGTWG